jgi:hypothetical protein
MTSIRHPLIWLRGFRECRSDFGMTYGNPDTARSRAYDAGRYYGRRLWRMR